MKTLPNMPMLKPAATLFVAASLLATSSVAALAQTSTDVTVMNGDRAVPATVVIPDGDGPFPAVVMNHGHGGGRQEGGGFERLANALAEAGLATIRMDFAGVGDSTSPWTDQTLDSMVSDSDASRDYLVENYPVDPDKLGILGYSMGGRVTLTIVEADDNPYKAVGLLAPSADPGKDLALMLAGSEDEYERLYAEAEEQGYADYTTQYGQEQQLSLAWFDGMLDSIPLDGDRAYTGPMLIVSGDKDNVIPADQIADVAAAYPEASSVIVPEADHGYGFYSDQPEVSALVENSFADFFSSNL
ncbi:alpha/beta hydrolase family protein [Devosia sp.]|uniref:alpha/beta hydrolase family protein n=1 Tax=Devosia sp. TaxID=1871048 RepID=UPI003A8F7202